MLLLPLTSYAYIPPQAFQYFPVISAESERLIIDFQYPYYFAGLIEHESCITLKHSKCWNPNAKLETSRELAKGLGQTTIAYRSDGSVRFDTLKELKRQHSKELKELSWSNITQRPDLQIRSIILMSRTNYNSLYMISDIYQRLAMTDAAYNGGLGGVLRERQQCGLKANCDPQKWFGNIELIKLKSTKSLYAGRSPYEINRHHVTDVLTVRMVKYKPYF